ncbi:uncharacterized protein LOC113280463 [Papaver somniferum]|uniref:uncharacterized protein LOC113280463 n=1 Tax=Papaver somniferum TaxID=3469 RepID=UPI000E6FEEDF|nr:uncharacterized protein LOC113280463 [Papaver somniferum]
MVSDMISPEGAWNLHFSRNLNDQELLEVSNLLQIIGEPNVSGNEDSRKWRYGDNFSVTSAYSALDTEGSLIFPDKQLWNSKVPLKVSFLVWTLCYSGAPTLDKPYAADLIQDRNYLLCNQMVETNEHLFIHCSFVFETALDLAVESQHGLFENKLVSRTTTCNAP